MINQVNVSVTGMPQGQAAEAEAIVRRVLQPWAGDDFLTVIVHRLNSGGWSVMAFDGADVVMLKGGLVDRVLGALHELTNDERP